MEKREEVLYRKLFEFIPNQKCQKLDNGCYAYLCSIPELKKKLGITTSETISMVRDGLDFLTDTQLKGDGGKQTGYCILGHWFCEQSLEFRIFVPNERYFEMFIPYMIRLLPRWYDATNPTK